jgi:hypothetical protein
MSPVCHTFHGGNRKLMMHRSQFIPLESGARGAGRDRAHTGGGDPSLAGEKDCDLVVMSATGASPVRALLIGANTRKVVHASRCPVLVIPVFNRVGVEDFLERARNDSRRELARLAKAGAGGQR